MSFKPTEEKDPSEYDEIDRILKGRVKKISIAIPPVPREQTYKTARQVCIPQSDYDHLHDEILGGKYGPAARPELEIIVVGYGAPRRKVTKQVIASQQPIDLSRGKGVELMFDPAKSLFIMTSSILDQLLLVLQNDPEKANVVNDACSRIDELSLSYVDPAKQRLWRRFVRLELSPLLEDDRHMAALTQRFFTVHTLEGLLAQKAEKQKQLKAAKKRQKKEDSKRGDGEAEDQDQAEAKGARKGSTKRIAVEADEMSDDSDNE